MQIIDAGEVLLAAGLEWEVSSTGSFNTSQLRSKARAHKTRHYVEHIPRHAARERLYGFGKLPAEAAKERRTVLSLASLVARAGPERLVFVAALGGGLAALVGVLGGQPVPRLDLVDTEQELVDELANFVAAHGIHRIHYAEALGRPEFDVPGCDWVALAIDADDRHLARIRRIRAPIGAPALIAGLVVTAAAAAVALVWQQREQTLEGVEQSVLPNNFGPTYASARQTAFARLPDHPADVLGVRMADWMLDQPIEHGGWKLSHIACSAAPGPGGRSTCSASWEPGSADTTFAAFGTASPSTQLAVSLDRIVTEQPIDVSALPSLSAAARYPLLQQFLLRDGSFFQSIARLGVALKFGAPTSVGVYSGPKVAGMVEQAQWSMSGPVRLMRTLLTALPPNMAIGTIDVALPGTVPSFDAKGVLYVTAP
jgi:hypothetical protein